MDLYDVWSLKLCRMADVENIQEVFACADVEVWWEAEVTRMQLAIKHSAGMRSGISFVPPTRRFARSRTSSSQPPPSVMMHEA